MSFLKQGTLKTWPQAGLILQSTKVLQFLVHSSLHFSWQGCPQFNSNGHFPLHFFRFGSSQHLHWTLCPQSGKTFCTVSWQLPQGSQQSCLHLCPQSSVLLHRFLHSSSLTSKLHGTSWTWPQLRVFFTFISQGLQGSWHRRSHKCFSVEQPSRYLAHGL